MIFHENRLLAVDSHEISYLSFQKLGKMLQNLSSAAVVIGYLRVTLIVIQRGKHSKILNIRNPNLKLEVFLHNINNLLKRLDVFGNI